MRPPEADEAEQMHACGVIDPLTGQATSVRRPGLDRDLLRRTDQAGQATSRHRRDHRRHAGSDRVVRIRSALPRPVVRCRHRRAARDDLGRRAGDGRMHPVVAIYSTFLNRAFDQVMMDVALHKLPVTMVLDRAGVTGPDGASHNGMWDLSMLGIVPGMRVAAPRDAARLREELARRSTSATDRPRCGSRKAMWAKIFRR